MPENTDVPPGSGVPVTVWQITGEAAALDFRVSRDAEHPVTLLLLRPDGSRLEVPLTVGQVSQAYRFFGQVTGHG